MESGALKMCETVAKTIKTTAFLDGVACSAFLALLFLLVTTCLSCPLVLVLSISKDLSRQPPEVLRRVQRVCNVWRCMEKLQ